MSSPDLRTPVIVGVGFCQEKLEDPVSSREAWQLMAAAIRDGAEDAGNSALLPQLESITVLKGMWEYKNPGKLLADELGCTGAKSILADVGNLQLGALFDLCNAIAEGKQSLGVVVGGEAKYRELRAKITGREVHQTQQGDEVPDPDVYVGIPDPFASDVEVNAGIFMPVELFAVIESALRHHQGLDIESHRNHIAALYSDFSKIAANNPRAWNREVVAAEDIRNASDKNAMLAFPYTKKFNSQWNVNQAAALIVCSLGKARELGLDESRWVYPLAGAQNRHVVCLAQKKQLHSQPASVLAGEAVYEMAGITAKDVTAADLYSCFPAAIQSYGQDLKLDHIPWSVSGSMAFAGGPYNHSSIDSVVRMVDVLREGEGKQIGLVSNLSGIYGKHGVALFSNQANPKGYQFRDVTEAVAKVDQPLPTNPDYTGPAKIVGYTVVHIKNNPSHAFVYCENEAGERSVVKTMDQDLLAKMMQEEFVGKTIQVQADKTFVLAN
jgi:acetyl-CoA C-acetyltransferase